MLLALTCPEVPLGVLGNQPVEVVLLCGAVQGHWVHAHGPTVLQGIGLLEGGTPVFPGGHVAGGGFKVSTGAGEGVFLPALFAVPWVSPEVVRGSSSTQAKQIFINH